MLSDYRIVRSVIDESNCFCACASISLSIQYIHHYFFLISKAGVKLPKNFAMATGSISTDSDPPESVSGVGNDSPKFCSPKGAKSPVWAHFVFLLDRQGKRANAKQVHCFHCREVGAHEKAIMAYCNNTTNLQQHLCTWHPEVLPSTSSSQTTRRIVTVYSRQCLACR